MIEIAITITQLHTVICIISFLDSPLLSVDTNEEVNDAKPITVYLIASEQDITQE